MSTLPGSAQGTRELNAWTAEDLEASGSHLVEIHADLARTLSRVLPETFEPPMQAAQENDFRKWISPWVAPIAQDISRRLGPAGPGLAYATGDALAGLSDGQLVTLFYGISVVLGRPVGQTPQGDRLVSVLDERPADVRTARGYRTSAHMLMHTDPTDVAGLLCLRQSASGGSSLQLSAGAVLDLITEQAPELVHHCFKLWDWDLRGTQRPGAEPIVRTPIFAYCGGELRCRYGALMLREGARHRGSGRPAPEDEAVLDLLEEVIREPAGALRRTLRRGESVWLNNYRVLHGREEFHDDARLGQTRHLLRTWIWLDDRPRLPSSFTAFCRAIDQGRLAS